MTKSNHIIFKDMLKTYDFDRNIKNFDLYINKKNTGIIKVSFQSWIQNQIDMQSTFFFNRRLKCFDDELTHNVCEIIIKL